MKEEYYIEGVDSNEIDLYIQDITEIHDPMEKLIYEKKILEIEKDAYESSNKKLSDENSTLKSENERLTTENEKLRDKMTDIEKRYEVKSLLSDFINKSSFIDYINSNQVTPVEVEGIDFNLKNLSFSNPFILGFNKPTDSELIMANYRLIVSRYKVKGTLNQFYKKLNDKSKYIVILGLALALNDLSNQNKIHGNLTPEVILLNNSNLPILCDFGHVEYYEQKSVKISNLFFIAPEIHEGGESDIKSDVYSYAMIVYLLLTNQISFVEGSPYTIITNILKGKRPDLSIIKDQNFRMILQKCFARKPKDRPTFDQIINILIEPNLYSAFHIAPAQINERYKTQYNELQIKPSENEFRIVCYGNTGTGKTAMIDSYCQNQLILNTFSTICANMSKHFFNTKYGEVAINIWDTSGQETFRSAALIFCRGANAIILFTDVSFYQEYKELQWFFDMTKDSELNQIPLYLATTKIDRGWANTKEEIESFANEHGMKLFVTSAYDPSTVDHMFKTIVDDIISL